MMLIFNKETMGLANGLDVRREGMKKMMSRCLVPFLVKCNHLHRWGTMREKQVCVCVGGHGDGNQEFNFVYEKLE